jgi:hypothetical protein
MEDEELSRRQSKPSGERKSHGKAAQLSLACLNRAGRQGNASFTQKMEPSQNRAVQIEDLAAVSVNG